MKLIFCFLFSLITYYSFGQTCNCDDDSLLNEIISCDTIHFENGAELYWNFNCDSSWLTLLTPTRSKQIIFSLGDGLQELTGRIGYVEFYEYKSTFLVQNNVISGCCAPPDFYLYDKTTGQKIKELGRIIYLSEDRKYPIIISITNSSYDTSKIADLNSLTIFNINTNKEYLISLPNFEIEQALENTEEMYAEFLFEDSIVENGILILQYRYRNPKNEEEQYTRNIQIELKKYGS